MFITSPGVSEEACALQVGQSQIKVICVGQIQDINISIFGHEPNCCKCKTPNYLCSKAHMNFVGSCGLCQDIALSGNLLFIA